jgi:putative ABC transport system ATP-binding protein
MKNTILSIENVALKIPGVEKNILSEINYQVEENDFIVILGSNGSGKSSLLKLLNHHYQPTSGKILFNSHTIKTLTQNCHESLFTSLTVLENCYLYSSDRKKNPNYFAEYIKKFNPNLELKLNQKVEKLSGGEKQALALALCVLHPPKILLLDEHTSALDPKSAQKLMVLTQEVVAQHKITCLLTTHDLDIALNYGNRILALRNGKILQIIDDKNSNLNQDSLLAACY